MLSTSWVAGFRSRRLYSFSAALLLAAAGTSVATTAWGEEAKQESQGAISVFLRAITRAVVPVDEGSSVTATPAIAIEGEAPAAEVADVGSHRQTRRIDIIDNDAGLRLTSFCLNKDGQIVALLGKSDGVYPAVAAFLPAQAAPKKQSELRIMNSEGEVVTKFDLDFAASAVNVGPDGNIYVGGNGVVAKFDATGKELGRSDAPHLKALAQDDAALEARARETMAENIESLKQAMASMEEQKKTIAEKSEEDLTDEERQMKDIIEPTLEAYRTMIAQQEDPEQQKQQLEQTMSSLASRQRTINAVSVNDQYVFVTCAASKGYGYAVWRTDLNFENGQQIVDGLRGCCGQMDVQCCDDEVIVAENARHRVVRFDAEGKETIKFGKRSRDGEGEGFGSCCNPMNTRLVGDQLYVAESDGTVKLFDRDGNFKEVIGRAKVEAGCKSSIVAADSTGDRVYYFDVHHSAICVLERQTGSVDDQASINP